MTDKTPEETAICGLCDMIVKESEIGAHYDAHNPPDKTPDGRAREQGSPLNVLVEEAYTDAEQERIIDAYREGQANPSPAAVARYTDRIKSLEDLVALKDKRLARVLREAADRAESFCKSKCEGCVACQISEAIEAMISTAETAGDSPTQGEGDIPESER